MEGARMTDEWPFIDQRIPDREVIFRKVDPSRRLEVVDNGGDFFNDLEFSFKSGDGASSSETLRDHQVTDSQMIVYPLVNGTNSVSEVILESTLIEFETCKAVAELLDRGLIREATQEEVARELRRGVALTSSARFNIGSLPWLAIPFLVLLGFSLTVMPRNPLNPGFELHQRIWNQKVLASLSWIGLDRVAREAETSYFLNGIYPTDIAELEALPAGRVSRDPWGRPYRLVTRGGKLLVTGTDADGQPTQRLILSRGLAWEGTREWGERPAGPGVQLLD
jgi:hypothetical protein